MSPCSIRWLAVSLVLGAAPLVRADEPGEQPAATSEAAALFAQLDANDDGFVTEDEVTSEQRRLFRRLLRAADKNEDGKLDRDEFVAGLETSREGAAREGTGRERPRRDAAEGTPREETPARSDEPMPRRQRTREGQTPGRSEGAGAGPGAAAFFQRLDTNGDGKLTLDEVPEERRERMRALIERADKDGDGALTLDEFTQAAGRAAGRPGDAAGPRRPGAEPRPDRPDAQAPEGAPDRPRRPGAGAPGRPQGAPGDGAMRRQGQPGERGQPGAFGPGGAPFGPSPGDALLRALDKDGDGRLSKEEIDGAAQALAALDRNNDGTISPDELRGPRDRGPVRFRPGGDRPEGARRPEGDATPEGERGPPGDRRAEDARGREGARGPGGAQPDPGVMVQRLMSGDKDGDGKLSEEEMPERLRPLFARIDANGDGFVDREELSASVDRLRRAAGQSGDARGGRGRGRPEGNAPDGRRPRSDRPGGERPDRERPTDDT